jgi:prepilin-type N-terminal cleavage/methylation domain-containing protein
MDNDTMVRFSQSGFTLVEVIVVSVVIAVISAIGIPMYNSYKRDSARSVADNVAGSAASFLASARHAASDWENKWSDQELPADYTNEDAGEIFSYTSYTAGSNGGEPDIHWKCPPGVTITILDNHTLQATVRGEDSDTYPY